MSAGLLQPARMAREAVPQAGRWNMHHNAQVEVYYRWLRTHDQLSTILLEALLGEVQMRRLNVLCE